jgi:hypothetical protein
MNDLVADVKKEEKSFTGAGPLDGIEDLKGNIDNAFQEGKSIDPVQLGIDGAGLALDVAGAVADPLGTLASSAIGWIIENVRFVREPFDKLMGDPPAIEAAAKTWENISKHLSDVANQHKDSLSQVREWTEQSGLAYRGEAANLNDHINNAAAGASSAGNKIKTAGAIVAATRALMRDLLAELAGTLLVWGLGALASAVPTAGASVAAFVVRAVSKALEIAAQVAKYLKQLFKALENVGGLAKSAIEALTKRADDLAQGGKSATAGRSLNSPGAKNTFEDAARNKADDLRAKADQWDQKAADNWQKSKDRGHGMDQSAWGHDRPGAPSSPAPDGSIPAGRPGLAERTDSATGKGMLDGQNIARAVFSGDLGHVAPKAGDVLYPAKEVGKEFNKAHGQDDNEKIHGESTGRIRGQRDPEQ